MTGLIDLSRHSHEQTMRILFGAAVRWNHHVYNAAQDRKVREIEQERYAEAVAEAKMTAGSRCRMHYRADLRALCPHGERGTILMTHWGKRIVRLDSGRKITCSMWNARPLKENDDV